VPWPRKGLRYVPRRCFSGCFFWPVLGHIFCACVERESAETVTETTDKHGGRKIRVHSGPVLSVRSLDEGLLRLRPSEPKACYTCTSSEGTSQFLLVFISCSRVLGCFSAMRVQKHTKQSKHIVSESFYKKIDKTIQKRFFLDFLLKFLGISRRGEFENTIKILQIIWPWSLFG
jgi:hypothetical protein